MKQKMNSLKNTFKISNGKRSVTFSVSLILSYLNLLILKKVLQGKSKKILLERGMLDFVLLFSNRTVVFLHAEG